MMVPGLYHSHKRSMRNVEIKRANVDNRRYVNSIVRLMADVNNVIETRLYGLSNFLTEQHDKFKTEEEKAILDNERQFIPQRMGYALLRRAFQVGVMIWSVVEIIAGRQPIGNFVLVQNTTSTLTSRFLSLGTAMSALEDLSNMEDFDKFMSLPVAEVATLRLKAAPEEIKISDLSFTYPTNPTRALSDINLTIKNGQHIAIVGENGAGKTTLTKLLCGLYRPSDGEILVDGRPLSKININDWHKQIAMLTQSFTQYTFATAKDNVLYGDINRPYNDDLYYQALEQSEAAKFVNKLPYGDETYMDSWTKGKKAAGTRISGGQWQRLALARSFYRNAPIVILDEPTSAIDAAAEARIFEHLFSDNSKTIIVISHRLSTIKKADKIYMLADGKIVESGTYRTLVNAHGAFYEMFKSQM